MSEMRQHKAQSVRVERVSFMDAVALFAGGFALGIAFNIGDFVMMDFVTGDWPPIFFYGAPIAALLWVVLPFATRPFVLTAALFLGTVFGFLGGTLLLLNVYNGAA